MPKKRKRRTKRNKKLENLIVTLLIGIALFLFVQAIYKELGDALPNYVIIMMSGLLIIIAIMFKKLRPETVGRRVSKS